MDGAKEDEKGEKESPPLQIDPKYGRGFCDALRAFFQPIGTGDPRLDFYTVYKREATENDADYVKKYDEDLNTTLIFAGLFSAVSSAFVIDVHSDLQPDPNDQSAALLRAILLTLNQSAIPGETPVVPPAPQDPSSEIVTVAILVYASLLISLLAAFVAMLGKQWLNRYLRNSGGSMIERCGDRQRKRDGLEKWPLHFFVESLPVMLQVALLLLACGLSRHMCPINTSVAYTLISLTGAGVLFYLAIVIAGISSYACPFQTPASTTLRSPWKKARRGFVSFIVHSKQALLRTHRMWNQKVWPLFHRQSLPTILLGNVQVHRSEPWLKPKDLDTIHETNANDVRCVSWILRNITDPEALDAAIRLAGTIRWFDDGINDSPPYDLIVSTFDGCFDSAGMVNPGPRDRAYYSGRAIVWIHTLAMCKSEEFASTFPLPNTNYVAPSLDFDLRHLLWINIALPARYRFMRLLNIPVLTPSHSQWSSNVLLHLSWANRAAVDFDFILRYISVKHEAGIPLNATLNRLLTWCIFLGSPVEEEALKVRDKSDRMERILDQLSKAIVSAVKNTHPQHKFVPHAVRDLFKLETRPEFLTGIAYEWCSMICENRRNFEDPDSLLLICLELGFRHHDPWHFYLPAKLTRTEHHRGLVDVVFESKNGEVISDLLHAWTAEGPDHAPAHILLGTTAGNLIGLHNLVPFSPKLRRLVIRSVELIGYKGFEGVGVERFIKLLNHLHVAVEDMDEKFEWAKLLLDTLQSSEGARHLSHRYWELLTELAVSQSRWLRDVSTYDPQIMESLTEVQEWSKLECWVGTVWIMWPSGVGGPAEEDLGRSMLSLFCRRRGASRRLGQWMERWSQKNGEDIPESFQRICKQAHEAAQQNPLPISSTDEGTEEPGRSSPPVPIPLSRDDNFWESQPYHVF